MRLLELMPEAAVDLLACRDFRCTIRQKHNRKRHEFSKSNIAVISTVVLILVVAFFILTCVMIEMIIAATIRICTIVLLIGMPVAQAIEAFGIRLALSG